MQPHRLGRVIPDCTNRYVLRSRVRRDAGRLTMLPQVSHAATVIDPLPVRRISSTRTTMESATPKKFKSNLLAALDLKPDLDDAENLNPLLTQLKRKQTPGSPDPRQPKRTTTSVRSNIPGLENTLCGCSRTVNSTPDLILPPYSVPAILQPPPSTAGLPKDHRQEFGINYNEDAPVSRLDLAQPDQQEQYGSTPSPCGTSHGLV